MEADYRAYAAWVKANEPGTILYSLNKSRTEPDTYHAIEIYEDDAAMQTHLKNFHARTDGPAEPLTVGEMEFMMLDRVG
ncbi:MAG: antibiotic biosynthesis monooxygenase [Caulobacteraceae bacterium]